MSPELSVLMPVWSASESYLTEALKSVIAQDFDNWELVIVEAPSDQQSDKVIGRFDDSRIRYHLQTKRTNLVDQLNFGLQQAQAEVVARFDADDVCEKHRFSTQLEYLTEHPNIDLVGSQMSIIDENGNVYANRDYPTDSELIAATMQSRNVIAHPAAMFRKKVVLDLGGYDEEFANGGEDYDLWVRMLKNGSAMANLPQRLLKYRHHPNQVKVAQLKKQLKGTIAVKERHFKNELGFLARTRLLTEKLLMYLPSAWVARLFQWIHLRKV